MNTALGLKVDKVANKSLVADSEITKLAGIGAGANVKSVATKTGDVTMKDLGLQFLPSGTCILVGRRTITQPHKDKHTVIYLNDGAWQFNGGAFETNYPDLNGSYSVATWHHGKDNIDNVTLQIENPSNSVTICNPDGADLSEGNIHLVAIKIGGGF
jgi:hypothetical protein